MPNNPLQVGQDEERVSIDGTVVLNKKNARPSIMMTFFADAADSHHASGKMETMDQGQREARERSRGLAKMHVDESTLSYLGYMLENRIASNPSFPFLAILIMFLIFFICFGIIWYAVGKDVNGLEDLYGTQNLADSFFLVLQMLSTGQYADGIPTKHGYRYLYFAMIFIGPTLIFAILIGFINDGVNAFMDKLKDGKTHVYERNHTLILGWNEATARVIVQSSFLRRQYQELNERKWWILAWFPLLRVPFAWLKLLERPSTSIAANNIVVMCEDKTKEEMHKMIQNTLDERGIKSKRTKIGQNIICRVGDPTNVNDLLRVGADKAAAIIVQVTQNDLEEEIASEGRIQNGATIRVALAVRNTVLTHLGPFGGTNPDLRIVLQMSKPSDFIEAACFSNSTGNEVMIPMDISVFLNTLMFKSASQPGLAKVLLQLFDFEGFSIRRRKARNLRGGPKNEYGYCCGLGSGNDAGIKLTFEEVQKDYDIAIFIGLVRPTVTDKDQIKRMGLGICPDPTIVIEPDDLLIFIGPKSNPNINLDMNSIVSDYKAEAERLFPPIAQARTAPPRRVKGTLICGWREVWNKNPTRLFDRIMQITKVCLPSSVITFLNLLEYDEFRDAMHSIGVIDYYGQDPEPLPSDFPQCKMYTLKDSIGSPGIVLRHIQGDASNPDTLKPIVFSSTIHSSIVLGTQKGVQLSPKARDTRVMCIMLLLRKLCKEKLKIANVPMHVVGENQEDMTARLALGPLQRGLDESSYRDPDFVNTQAIYARVLTQALAYPLIVPAIRDLFDEEPGSSDIFLASAKNYVPMNQDISIGVVKQLVLMAHGERSIFVGYQDQNGAIYLMPEHSEYRVFNENERLIIFKRILV